jgi:hypothetical protein
MYPKTTTIVCRKTFTDLKATIVQNTFPKMFELRFGEEYADNPKVVDYNLSPPMYAEFFNGSRVYFIGLEDNANFEKILGRQCSMFLIDEASEVGYRAFSKLTTRMSEKTGARKVGFITMNPTSVFHWTYKIFIGHQNPLDDKPLKNPQIFKWIQMNPVDNLENLPEGYIDNLENLSEGERERFLYGNFTQTLEGAVYEEQLKIAKEDGRIRELGIPNVNYPIYFSLDIGWDDFTSAWIFQVLPNKIAFYSYIEAQRVDVVSFVADVRMRLKELQRGIRLTSDIIGILPHDALQHSVQTGMNVKQLLSLHETAANYAGETPISYKQLKLKGKYDGVNVSRLFFKKCTFDERGCEVGLRRLGQYKEILIDGNDEFKKELVHDASSHAADSFRYAMVNVHETGNLVEPFNREEGKMYGWDLLNEDTKRILY